MNQNFQRAFGMISTKAQDYNTAVKIAAVQITVENQLDKYNRTRENIFKSHGAKYIPDRRVYDFDDKENPMPETCYLELAKLLDAETEHELEPIELPKQDKEGNTIFYEPFMLSALYKILKK